MHSFLLRPGRAVLESVLLRLPMSSDIMNALLSRKCYSLSIPLSLEQTCLFRALCLRETGDYGHMKGVQDRHSVPNAPQEREFREDGGMHRPSCGAATLCCHKVPSRDPSARTVRVCEVFFDFSFRFRVLRVWL